MNIVHRARKNFFFKLMGEIGSRALALGFYIIIARKLGAFNFGRYSFAYSFTALFVILMNLGVDTILIRDVSRLRQEVKTYVANINVLKLFLSIITWVIIHFMIIGLGYPKDVIQIVDLMALVIIGTGILEYVCAIFNAFEQMQYETFLKVINKILFLALGVGALLAGLSLTGLLKGLILAYAITIFIGFLLINNKITPLHFNFDFKFCQKLLKLSFPVFLSFAFLTIYKNLDVVFLSLFHCPEQEIGWYTSTVKLGDVLRAIPVLCVGAVFPIFSSLSLYSKEKLKKAVNWLIKLLCLFSIPLAFGTSVLSGKIIFFVYGKEYLPAALALAISIWAFIFVFVNYAIMQFIVIIDKQKFNIISSGCALIVNAVLNVFLIPHFGYLGPPFALLGAEIVLFLINLYFSSIFLLPVYFKNWIWKIVLAGFFMGGVLIYLHQLNIFMLFLLGVCIYVFLLFLFRVFSTDDVNFMKKVMART